ncbi:hypothetical protein [Shewanella frigidimarina]|uniref:hypothetical protein n=1 Tax=Shewanella frigidimarina TaxID=56812 RepID=UPI003D79A95B
MPIKKSVRLVDDTIKLCHELTIAGETNWSGSINAMAEQYKLLIDDNMPEMLDNQWSALYCVFNGYMPHPSPKEEAKLLPWHISEGYQYDEQVRSFLGDEVQAVAFVEVLKLMSLSQRLAVIYKARAYWRQGPTGPV